MLDKSRHYAVKCTLLTFVFCETLLISAVSKPLAPNTDKKWVVVIDAGHGGKDPGCHGSKYKEKDVALAVALKLGHLIEQNDNNVKVIYTRSTDVFVPLNERAAIANRNHADFFICIHCNASPDNTKFGSATYVMASYKSEGNLEVSKRENASILYEKDYKVTYGGFDPNSDEANILFAMYQNAYLSQSLDLSAKIQKEYTHNGRVDNGVKQAGFLVLWKTTMPSLLTEMGFLTNPQEESFIGSQKGQTKIAESIFFALQQYIDEKEGVTFHAGDFKLTPPQPDSTDAIPDSSAKVVHIDTVKAQAGSPQKTPPKDADKIKKLAEGLHTDSTTHTTINKAVDTTPVTIAKKLDDTAKIIYKVQIAISPTPLSMKDPRFKAVSDVEMYVDKSIYKYTSGHFTTLDDAVKLESTLRAQGFKDAFIVALKGNVRVPVVRGK